MDLAAKLELIEGFEEQKRFVRGQPLGLKYPGIEPKPYDVVGPDSTTSTIHLEKGYSRSRTLFKLFSVTAADTYVVALTDHGKI